MLKAGANGREIPQNVYALRLLSDYQKLNPGNLNAWLKHGDSDKISLDTARQALRYVDAASAR